MTLPVVMQPEAEAELHAGREWYEQQRPGLGAEFVAAVLDFFDQVAAFPALFAVAHQDVRSGSLDRFPYVVYYRAAADRIDVIAIMHKGRDPQVWQDRV